MINNEEALGDLYAWCCRLPGMWVYLDYMRRKRKMLKVVQYAMLIIAIVLLVSTVTGLIINKEMNIMTTLFMSVALIVYFGIELIKKKNNE
jgi:hypothetical protein